MKNILRILALLGLPVLALAQTATPSTTLCGAMTAIQTSVCLTATTNIQNQTGIYVDSELMIVTLPANQVVAAGPSYVPVRRGVNSGAGPQAAHNNGAVAWLALIPASASNLDNGFQYSTQLADVGPCTRGSYAYLPHIWPDAGRMRDCPVVNGATTGMWGDYNPVATLPGINDFQLLTVNGALPVTTGSYIITKGSLLADTLAAPTATVQDGTMIHVVSVTAFAHTITATGLLQVGTASVNVITFPAFAGGGITLMAYQGKWVVVYNSLCTFS